MQGKADMLVAKRTLSALIVVCVVVSAFAGILYLAQPAPVRAQAIGDLTITSGTYTIENILQPIDGNVNVSGSGELVIRDGTLSVISNNIPAQMHEINVRAGGHLILEHGTITTYLDQVDPWPFLTLTVESGGQLSATDGSLLKFPGQIDLNSGAVVSLHDTTVTRLSENEVNMYANPVDDPFGHDFADDGPTISVTDASLQLFDSVIDAMPEYPILLDPSSNLVVSGASDLLAINSYIGIDFVSGAFTHNILDVRDSSVVNLYGTSFEPYLGDPADRVEAVLTTGESLIATPSAKGPEDTTGQLVASLLQSNEGMTYQVGPGARMALDSFDAGPSQPIDGATLVVKYKADASYSGTGAITFSTNEGATSTSTGIAPSASETAWVEKTFDLFGAGVVSSAMVSTLDINFLHNGGAGNVQIDSLSIIMSVGSQAYAYRWLNVTVGDEYGVPIPGASISAVITGSTEYGGQPAFYFWNGNAQSAPPIEVLDYLAQNSTSYSVTGSDGIAHVPYLTDMISGSHAPNSLYVGALEITGSALIKGTWYQSKENFAFPAYPAMTSSDQSYDVTVELTGVSAPSPDQSRWLVVPPSLTISHMSYYHAGDVIVAADGTLTLEDVVFELVQATANQRTVYVDGTDGHSGQLLILNSTMTSALPINIIVKGHGILKVANSDLIGVNIVAQGDAQVILENNVTMDGTLTTSWDSSSIISVSDSDLEQAVTLSGASVGGFTNTSVPSISVTDDALAQIFRWIHVLVKDGAGQPLPRALVRASSLVSPPGFVWSAITDNTTGVAKVKSLATNITSGGTTFTSNYLVNASYNYPAGGPKWYYAEEEVAVGVLVYTEPLGRNATYLTMTIPDVKPDLAIHAVPVPVTITQTDPDPHLLRGDRPWVTAVINNDGLSAAFNVRVNFYDYANVEFPGGEALPNANYIFATAFIDQIDAGGNKSVTVAWTAGLPITPEDHEIVVVADPLNELSEMNESWVQATYAYSVTVQALPDLQVAEITPDTAEIDRPVNIVAHIWNSGDWGASGVLVEFYDGSTLIGSQTVPSINPGYWEGVHVAITTTFTSMGGHLIWVSVDPDNAIVEVYENNNNVSSDIEVLDHPDLWLDALTITDEDGVLVTQPIKSNTTVTIRADLWNINKAPVWNPKVTLWINITGGDSQPPLTITVNGMFAEMSYSGYPSATYTAPRANQAQTVVVTMVVNQDLSIVETDYSNNIVTTTFTIKDDRPDLSVVSSDITVLSGKDTVQSDTFGSELSIVSKIRNAGGRETTFKIRVNLSGAQGYNHTISTDLTYNISSNTTDNTKDITIPWTVNQWVPGPYQIWVTVDPGNQISEPNEANNIASKPFTITQLSVILSITTNAQEFKAGKTMVVTATIQFDKTNFPPVKGLEGVTFFLYDNRDPSNPVKIETSITPVATTDQSGKISQSLIIPLDLESGSYVVGATVAGVDYSSGAAVQISSAVQGGLFPFWVWLIIIVAVVAVVVGFTLYTYIYGLGKLVECGECGAFIPAASKRCPKCGVEFEAGTMKCSECGAWIPADSAECPNCGVKFVGEVEDQADYMERMRKEYDEMVSKYRELAKIELGKKFSDREFDDWWRNQPGYITFDDWLAKEEEKKKEGPVPCPVCGTLNPKEATVCHKCGTVFAGATAQVPGRKGPPPVAPSAVTPAPAQPEAGAQQQPPGAAPRMVIRRPIDRKVVPKKIIKTPLGEETTQSTGDENEENQ